MELALFDLDHTLLNGDTNHEWLGFLADKGLVDPAEVARRQDEFYQHYKDGTLDILVYLRFQLLPLAGQPMMQLIAWRDEFTVSHLQPRVTEKARALVANHRDRGHLLAIVTATHSFVAAPTAMMLGIEHIIAPRPQIRDGMFTGDIEGTPCFRQRKIECLEKWLSDRGWRTHDFSDIWFYSDSVNDLHLLEAVSRPVAVDPDERLREYALSRGWPVISLR